LISKRQLRIGSVAVVACLALGAASRGGEVPKAAGDTPGLPAQIDFAKDVVPFLTKHCYSCHGNGKKKADLTLETLSPKPLGD